ncbi:beta strand repeat-containing protein [Limnobacter sp.]|uniref:beta strand repeat-containing protein n=1 Tax=Limnobacter sp. TaxID=2003368 RepID=UPI002FE18E82
MSNNNSSGSMQKFTATVVWSLWVAAFIAFMLVWLKDAHAAPVAGTSIGNQASATYTDGSQTTRTVTSNTVVTIVQHVASLTLTADGNKNVTAGGQVSFPHTLTNTGNGVDQFSLATVNSGAFTFDQVKIYADLDGDGVPDNSSEISNTGDLAPGQAYNFVIVGQVPTTASSGSANDITVTATSGFDSTKTASNTDTTTVSSNAVVNVTKSIDVASGSAGSGPYTYTLTYNNTGNSAASNLVITDDIPDGMTYVPGSGRWTSTGATVLTDLDATDDQGGIVYDFNVTTTDTVRAVVAVVPAGSSASISFQVNVDAGLDAGSNPATLNTAYYSYNDGSVDVAQNFTNSVQFRVDQIVAVSSTGDSVEAAAQGSTVTFNNVVRNDGNGEDTFDLTMINSSFPAGTAFVLYQADGVSPLLDSDGDGVPDTGPLGQNESVSYVVKAILPSDASAGGPYTVEAKATSSVDVAVFAVATDALSTITSNSVDLTNDVSGAGAPGFGPGAEAVSVDTNPLNPGSTTTFTLAVANSSSVADNFNLLASTDSTFSTIGLPEGWSVVFRDTSGAVITNTGVVNGGSTVTVTAEVSVPADYMPGTEDIYFRAVSPNSGAGDIVHNAVTVNTVRNVVLESNHSGQVSPGGTVTYTHTLSNLGNVTEGNGTTSSIDFALVDDKDGFSSIVHWDINNNGVLDPSDPVVTDASQLTGGSNGASTNPGLDPGESATLFVKVQAGANATAGAMNTSSLSATTSGTIDTQAAPTAASVDDATTVIAGSVKLVKKQALDTDCNGLPDTAFTTADLTNGAVPDACIRYEITARNVGVSEVLDLVVSDATPVHTIYHAVSPAAATAGTVTAPAADDSGTIQVTANSLAPDQTLVLTFGVKIMP